jgi:transposase-like protein
MKSPVAIETLEVARQDGRGRRLAGGAEREALIAAFAQSGMTQQAFAEREGINRFTLATWLRKKRAEGLRSEPQASPRFVEVGMPPLVTPTAAFSLEVVLADGVVIRGHDAQQLAVLVRRLR